MDFGNIEDCIQYVGRTVVPLLQARLPDLQTVHLRGTNFAIVNFGETKIHDGTEFIAILLMVLPDVNQHLGPGVNPTISAKLINGDLVNRDMRFIWSLDDIVGRISYFQNH